MAGIQHMVHSTCVHMVEANTQPAKPGVQQGQYPWIYVVEAYHHVCLS
jgi:hypothetical protein